MLSEKIKIIAFDADDTLWINEPYFQETEHKFCGLLEDYLPHHSVSKELFKIEMKNLPIYGYGVKAFVLSMIETVSIVTENKATIELINRVLALGKELLEKPVIILEGVEDVLKKTEKKYRLVMATKGDLLDQEKKLIKSGLEKYFHHIEVMSEKTVKEYKKLLWHLDCPPENFLMVGNSIKSDILPVLELGGNTIHIPYHTTWAHEEVKQEVESSQFLKVEKIGEILKYL